MPDFNPTISYYTNAKVSESHVQTDLLHTLDTIRAGNLQHLVDQLQATEDEKERTELKKKFPAVTWSGLFKKRNAKSLTEYSHIICHDIDKLEPEQLHRYRNQLISNPYVLAYFTSPSGKGLKVLFRTNTGDSQHLEAWTAIGNHLTKSYPIAIDESGKDICRLCFLSSDPDLYYNPDCDVIEPSFITEHTPVKPKPAVQPATQPAPPVGDGDQAKLLDKCHNTVQKTVKSGPGTHNKYAGQFAQQANRWGIPLHDCLAELQRYQPDYDQKELATCVQHHYNKEAGRFAEYHKNTKPKAGTTQPGQTVPAANDTQAPPSRYNDGVTFWDVFTKKDGEEEKKSYKLSYDKAITFLQNNGFFKFELKGDRYKLIYLDRANKVVYNVNELRVTEYMLGYLKSKDTYEIRTVRELFRRSTGICADQNLKGLDYYLPQLRKETATSGALYFQNCWVDITATGSTPQPYTAMEDLIWKNQVIDRDYTPGDWHGCDIDLFLCRAILGHKNPRDSWTDADRIKIDSLHTTIGYMLHTYRDPSVMKMVAAVDGSLREGDENNGRTGKSMLAVILGKVINVTYIDGKKYREDDKFAWQKVTSDTRIVWLDDPKKGLDITNFFSMATEGMDVEKKNMGIESFEKENSPKIYIPMNYTLRGEGGSARDRLQILEFSNYYSDEHKPVHEFKHLFFYDWDNAEWSRFYSLIIHCKQLYLKDGLIDFPLENYNINKLIERAGQEFVDYMDDLVLANLNNDPDALSAGKYEYNAKELHDAYLSTLTVKFPPKPHEITLRIRMWAKERRLIINPRTGGTLNKPGKRDKRSNITYITFAKADDAGTPLPPAPAPGTVWVDGPEDTGGKLNF